MKLLEAGWLSLGLVLAFSAPATAALTVFLELPGVDGESDAPGRPDVIALDSLSIAEGGLVVAKLVDSTSPALFSAAVLGTPYANASLLFYDDLLADAGPDRVLALQTVYVTAIQALTLGSEPGEQVSFGFAAPALSLYLTLPGVDGEATAPGQPDVIEVESIGLSTSGFSVSKRYDSTSPALSTAAASGTPYATASLLFYEDVLSASGPDFTLAHQDVFVSSIAPLPSPLVPKEEVSFVSAAVQVVPEPGILAQSLAGTALLAALARRLRLERPRA